MPGHMSYELRNLIDSGEDMDVAGMRIKGEKTSAKERADYKREQLRNIHDTGADNTDSFGRKRDDVVAAANRREQLKEDNE